MWLSLSLAFMLALMPLQEGTAVQQSNVQQSEAAFARGVELQQKGDLEGARDAYQSALRAVPDRADALSNLGVVFARLGQYDEAIKYYKQALTIDPKQSDTRLNLGIAYYKTEEFDAASRELAQVVAAQPANYQAHALLGLCYYQLNKLPEAINELEVVYQAQPDNVAVAYALGTAYINLNQTDKAEPLISQVFSRIDSAEAHLIVGSFYLAVKNFPKAIEELQSAVTQPAPGDGAFSTGQRLPVFRQPRTGDRKLRRRASGQPARLQGQHSSRLALS